MELTGVMVAVAIAEGAMPFQLAVDEVPAVLVALGVGTHALAVGLAALEVALVSTAVFEFQVAGAGVLIIDEAAPVAMARLLQKTFALTLAPLETAGIGQVASGERALSVEQALLELSLVDFSIRAVPFAGAVPLTILEGAGVPAAVGVVHAALALQQAIDHLPMVLAAIRKTGISGQQGFTFAAGGEQQAQGQWSEWAHGRVRAIEAPSMP